MIKAILKYMYTVPNVSGQSLTIDARQNSKNYCGTKYASIWHMCMYSYNVLRATCTSDVNLLNLTVVRSYLALLCKLPYLCL